MEALFHVHIYLKRTLNFTPGRQCNDCVCYFSDIDVPIQGACGTILFVILIVISSGLKSFPLHCRLMVCVSQACETNIKLLNIAELSNSKLKFV